PPEFGLDVVSVVEGEPSPKAPRLAGWAVGKGWVGVQARAGGVAPGALTALPGRDDPVATVTGPAGSERGPEELVPAGLAGEPLRPLQQHAVLHAQARQLRSRPIVKPELHAHGLAAGDDLRAKGYAIGKPPLAIERTIFAAVPFLMLERNSLLGP